MFRGRFTKEGAFDFGQYTKAKLRQFMAEHPGLPFEIVPLLPESKNQRGFFEGAICPLLAFYQEGMDHHDAEDVRNVREWLKIEFNGDFTTICGKSHKVPKSTKNKLNQGFLERVIGYIEDNYTPPREALDTESFKKWRDTVFPFGGPDNYIDYLAERNIL